MFSIKAVSEATGLSVETLRAWERRYAVVVPGRDASGRRVYRAEDVIRLRRLREATERGHPIGRLSQLDEHELAELLQAPADGSSTTPGNVLVRRMLEAAERFRPADCEQCLTLAISLMSAPQLFDEVLKPLLTEVGNRWHRGQFSIAQERLISGAVRKHLGLFLDTFDRNSHGRAIVFATLEGERHELGLLMSAILCASRGFKVHYLGPDLPAAEIARYAREVGASVVALSVVLQDGLPVLSEALRELVAGITPEQAVWLGGSAVERLDAAATPERCTIVRDPFELERRLDMLAA
jgi:DNA-binding transcriptional MerR regulator/methylmalonyl-CoA mutase cobalamin-binding subunit